MTDIADGTAGPRLATRLSFFAGGFAMACWAPIIPFAKERIGASEAELGLLLLCLGIGSVIAMPITGWVSARHGARPMILLGGFGLALMLPLLALAPTALLLGVVIFLLGASLGTLDVSMNVHAVEVEKRADVPLMSGFHALFSVGGFVGAGGVTGLLALGAGPTFCLVAGGLLTLAAMALAAPRLIRAEGGEPLPFALPRGLVLLLALLAAIMFLVEGAMLDWGALLSVERGIASVERAGLGFMLFNLAMTAGRLTGDRVVAALGQRKVLIGGGLVAMGGLALLLLAPWPAVAFLGFVLIGLGAANLVPVVFSLAGRQTSMPSGLAVAAVTTAGYAGVLLGPAAIGFVSHATSLPAAFWMLTLLVAVVPLAAGRATAKG
ncbi:MFS transporter [Pseudoroseicyclus tamaricis]|uniref:MFS transporter n=1 Tax=Pseudoroseicyclus tamaricis TaxID=2705421 RepID=A0A6B2JX96_9RHOB|nr:MFS transporter [Pseudoroseicyclus tamaricis]NDV00864.1 MFS transporter [Pseudoroseicyclus tamaricis]